MHSVGKLWTLKVKKQWNYDFEKNTFKKREKTHEQPQNGARNFAFSHTSKSISVILFAGNLLWNKHPRTIISKTKSRGRYNTPLVENWLYLGLGFSDFLRVSPCGVTYTFCCYITWPALLLKYHILLLGSCTFSIISKKIMDHSITWNLLGVMLIKV